MTTLRYLTGTVALRDDSCVQCAVCHEPVSTVADMYRHVRCRGGQPHIGWFRSMLRWIVKR